MVNIPTGCRRILLGLHISEPDRFSALCVLGRVGISEGVGRYVTLQLLRFPALSELERIAEIVSNIVQSPFVQGRRPIIVLSSEIGSTAMRKTLFNKAVRRVIAVNLTGGQSISQPAEDTFSIAKREVGSHFLSVAQVGRFKLDLGDPKLKAEFERQLQNFSLQIKRRPSSEDFEEQEIVEEDLALSVACSLWYAEVYVPSDRSRRPEIQPEPDPHEMMGYRRRR